MSSQRQMRKERRESSIDPINFTCGICKQVHKFNSDDEYKCIIDKVEVISDGAQ